MGKGLFQNAPNALFIYGKFALIFLLCSFPRILSAQEQNLSFSHLTINDGLAHNRIFDIIQDNHGFIWVATLGGINKYDAYTFKEIKPSANHGLGAFRDEVHVLLEDSQENIWAGSINGLMLLDGEKEKFKSLTGFPNATLIENSYITSLLEDKIGNIWMGTYEGLRVFNLKEKSFAHFYPQEGYARDMAEIKVKSLFLDTANIIWVGLEKGLKRFNPATKEFLPLPDVLRHSLLQNSQINKVNQDASGNFWFGTENNGLFHYKTKDNSLKNWIYIDSESGLPGNMVRDIFHASKGEVWIGTREGLSIFNISENRFTNHVYDKHNPDGLTHNSIWKIMEDRAGSIWLGTYYGGINIFHPQNKKFNHIREQIGDNYGVNHRVVSSVVQDDDGALWIGTEGGGLNYIDRTNNSYTFFTNNSTNGKLLSNSIKALAKDSLGNLWIGTYDGLSFFQKQDKRIKKIDLPKAMDKKGNHQIYSLATDNEGLWIGTNGEGLLFRSHAGQYKTMQYNPDDKQSLSSNFITSLLNLEDDQLWVGTRKGLNLYQSKEDRFTQFLSEPKNPNSITNSSILGIFQDSRKWLWIGTDGGGLNIYNPLEKKFYFLSETEGLANNVVHAIQEDEKGHIWVSTNKGLSKIILKQPSFPLNVSNISIYNYTVADGLQSNQFLNSSVTKGRGGELFFGGINGLTAFFPNEISQNEISPKVVLTDFMINNKVIYFYDEGAPFSKPIIENPDITLSYDQTFISFNYVALNFVNSSKNQFAYKLEGLSNNDDWNYVGNQRTATFTNLTAGNYVFKVKAANNDGVWNHEATQVHITVLPPYWKTRLAYGIYAFFIIIMLFLFYVFSLRNEKLKNKLLIEQMAREKDQELNQQKLIFFTNISHEIKTPLTLILAPLDKLIKMNEGNNKVNNQLMLMQRNGERLIRLINQLLDFRKFEAGNVKLTVAEGDIVKFIREVFIAFEVYTHQKNLNMQFSAEKETIMAWFDRDKLEKILYNLLSNAIKFTPEDGEVSVNIRLAALEDSCHSGTAVEHVVIEVVDNGIGISEENISKIFERYNYFDESESNLFGTGIGLSYSKGLVELHKGEITVMSKKAEGRNQGHTCFSIRLPLGKKHFREEEIITDFKNSDDIESYEQKSFPVDLQVYEKRKKILEGAGKHEPVMLVVEDNVEVLQFIVDNFAEEFEIYTANDGKKGLEVALEVIPDIIISDVMMPRMSGTALCKELKIDPRTSHIPVILLTARTPLIFKLEGLEIGADDYITKPFNLHFLEARVWNLLDSRQQLKERFRQEFFLQPKNVAINSPDEIFLEKAIKFIEANIAEPTLKVENLGKEIGMSRITLYRKIKGLTNQTVVDFIRSFRLKRAAQMLEQNKLQVNEVAYMVGFQDVDYFRKCFKEQFGYTPTEYSKENAAGK